MFVRRAGMVPVTAMLLLACSSTHSQQTESENHPTSIQPTPQPALGGVHGGGGQPPISTTTITTAAVCKDEFRNGGVLAYKGKYDQETEYYHTCADVAAVQPLLPNGICDKMTGANGHTFEFWCYKSCTKCDDNDDIEVLSTVSTVPVNTKPAAEGGNDAGRTTTTTTLRTTMRTRARQTTQASLSTACPTTREHAGLCVNQGTDPCHAHKCSIPPSCKCHLWETKLNVSGTNGISCYVCVDPPPPPPPSHAHTTTIDMNAVWAALGGGVILLVLVIMFVWYREKKAAMVRRRRSRQMGGGGGGFGDDDDDDVAMLVPDANAEANSLEEAIKLLPWLADAEQKRAGLGGDDDDADAPSHKPSSSMGANSSGFPIARVTERSPSPSLPVQRGDARPACSCINPKGSKARFCPTCGGVAVMVAAGSGAGI